MDDAIQHALCPQPDMSMRRYQFSLSLARVAQSSDGTSGTGMPDELLLTPQFGGHHFDVHSKVRHNHIIFDSVERSN